LAALRCILFFSVAPPPYRSVAQLDRRRDRQRDPTARNQPLDTQFKRLSALIPKSYCVSFEKTGPSPLDSTWTGSFAIAQDLVFS
jgi:hypothetical protein